jgi:6-phosphogluconate dehydrogenase (decarboxylating)
VTHDTVEQLSTLLKEGDIVIDGGNSNYKDSVLHATMLEPKGIEFVDCGTSGGIWGLTEGYSLMIGGNAEVVGNFAPSSRLWLRARIKAGVMSVLMARGIMSRWSIMGSSMA